MKIFLSFIIMDINDSCNENYQGNIDIEYSNFNSIYSSPDTNSEEVISPITINSTKINVIENEKK